MQPAYLNLAPSELADRVAVAVSLLSECRLCRLDRRAAASGP